METTIRRQEIQKRLELNDNPIKGSQLAKEFKVSRQVIVQDIAILRASNIPIVATPTGYLIQTVNPQGILKTICCCHGESLLELKTELELIISYGGKVIDVIVEHPIYGEIRAVLNLATLNDVQKFIGKIETKQVKLLSLITEGIHYHTLEVASERMFQEILAALKVKNILYEA